MDITIKINTDNAAFQDSMLRVEVSGILETLSKEIDRFGIVNKPLRDINGNTCGYVKIERGDNESDSTMG